jgi:transglutaminase-like putative cysteine protease
MDSFLQTSSIVDWHHSDLQAIAQDLARAQPQATARACFEWVRDRIRHSSDARLNPVTCRASEVLKFQTGYCYAKSHLLAALLRANGIPAGFCYQRLKLDDSGSSYCLHGLNAVYLPAWGWYRIDPRGNKAGIDAQFAPPREQLAYTPQETEETDFPYIFSEPLPQVVAALQQYPTWDRLLANLPDATDSDIAAQGVAYVYLPSRRES